MNRCTELDLPNLKPCMINSVCDLFCDLQAPKNRPSDRSGRCLKVRGRIHTVPVTSDRTSVFSGHPSQNSVPKLTYFKTQSYLVLSLAL